MPAAMQAKGLPLEQMYAHQHDVNHNVNNGSMGVKLESEAS